LYKMGVACGPHSGCLVGESGGDGLLGGHWYRWEDKTDINFLKPTGYLMHQQIWHSKSVHSTRTVFMCFIFILEQTATFALYDINGLFFL
jgi:hypothetical protein